jgi:glycogen debranching enzyme
VSDGSAGDRDDRGGEAAPQGERARATGQRAGGGTRRAAKGSERILNRDRPSVRARFVQPIVLKQAALFLLCLRDGDILEESDQGLYFHDMRHLAAQTLRLSGQPPVSLLAHAGEGWRGLFELTNPDLYHRDGSLAVRKETVGVRREKRLGDDYREHLVVANFGGDASRLQLGLSYAADFADMFVVRGTQPGRRGTLHPPRWDGSSLLFAYEGADGHCRRTVLRFSQEPERRDETSAEWELHLEAQQSWELEVTADIEDRPPGRRAHRPRAGEGADRSDEKRARSGAMGRGAQLTTSNPMVNAILARSFMDLHMLRMRQAGDTFFAAGVPWYVALFGRDSLVTALQVAAFEPEIGAATLRVLSRHQGQRVDDWRDEQPGKILHELRVDEMANLDEIPQTPYYGSVDSTPLFLILLGRYSSWKGTLELFDELRPNVEAALEWIDRYGDSDGDGFVDYRARSPSGARNQGWKDSSNGVVMEDGSLAEPPIALPEVQGDVYLALLSCAALFERAGEHDRAAKLRARAAKLRAAFNDAFWIDEIGYYAFCRQGDGRFSRSVASNPAHAVWPGIVADDRVRRVVERVLADDMFCGWGVRTLSSRDRSYNPIDYQVGRVWPHDNAFIVEGACRHGLHHEAERIFEGIMAAAFRFRDFRLPEVFAGFDRDYASEPVEYPVACNPQAWAAGAVPAMLSSLLGLQPEAFERRLVIRHPHLPQSIDWAELRGLAVGGSQVDLRYERSAGGTLVAVTRRSGDVTVSIEP